MNKILLLTGFTKNVFWDDYGNCDYGKLSALNHLEYATKHNYSYHCEIIEDFLLDRNQTWHKIQLIQKYLKIYDYVAWIDADAVFINKEIKLEQFIDPEVGFILPEMQIDKRTGLRLTKTSTGFMIIKNCESCINLLNKMWADPKNYAFDGFHEQSLLDEIIFNNHLKDLIQLPKINIISELYHNTDENIKSQYIYHAGGNTQTKYSRIKNQLSKN